MTSIEEPYLLSSNSAPHPNHTGPSVINTHTQQSSTPPHHNQTPPTPYQPTKLTTQNLL